MKYIANAVDALECAFWRHVAGEEPEHPVLYFAVLGILLFACLAVLYTIDGGHIYL